MFSERFGSRAPSRPMKLLEALEILKRPQAPDAPPLTVVMACGFTPLHLKTFLAAELRQRCPVRRVSVEVGLFGDLLGTIERCAALSPQALAVVLEWQDFDPRLGIRTLGGWRHEAIPGIVDSALRQMERISAAVRLAAAAMPVAVSLPCLPLPPMFPVSGTQAGVAELRLRQGLLTMAAGLAELPQVRIARTQRLDEMSPAADRFDVRSEITAGFPYTTAHASRLAVILAALIAGAAPQKGLITDLDDTFWGGIVGEAGVSGVSWDLEHGTQIHGIYQQFLSSLASAGVLLAVASKNDAAVVEEAMRRRDILCGPSCFYPLEVHWQPKSGSVGRILKEWNIAPEAVVFVDDSPMELAEVGAAYPEMECIAFPRDDAGRFWAFLERLRDLFGKASVQAEDAIRLDSIRAARQAEAEAAGGSADDLLSAAEAVIEFRAGRNEDARAFELVNKTNQFNLNGRRWDQATWYAYLAQPEALLLTASYTDKYGPLGKIAAVLARCAGRTLEIDAWVMSCRAFSRRIEHQCLKYLFERTGAAEIAFDFIATPRNTPLRDFLVSLIGAVPEGRCVISQEEFSKSCPRLFHRVAEVAHA